MENKNFELKDILETHALIEASAGTGKTYTIVELIKIAILEKNIKPEEILVVTFTEKARGELKDRITKAFQDIVDNNSLSREIRKIAQKTLNEISNFEINTIHGFCNTLISRYPFEIESQFNNTIFNNEDKIIENIFFSYLRKDIFNDFKEEAKDLLSIIGFYDNETEKRIEKILGYIFKINYLFKIDKKEYSKEKILDKLNRVKKILENFQKNGIQINIKNTKDIDFFDTLLSKKEQNFNSYFECIKKILELKSIDKDENFKNTIKEFYDNYIDLKNEFINFLAKVIFEKEANFKFDNELVSFNDMIHLVYNAIIKEDSRLLSILQNRFKYGFIDEFQDTDFIQWAIFKKIFIDSNSQNKLILIGDPKQSIYKFRNADINSYFIAKDEIEQKGKIFTLKDNYRSTEILVENYNKIFSFNNYFITNKINYTPIQAKGAKYEVKEDEKYKGLYFYKIEGEDKDKDKDFLDFIIKEILNLVNGNRFLIKKNEEKEFRAPYLGEIAILVSSRDDAKKIQKFLLKHKIESIFYKKDLLFQSDEAIQILYLLDYLTDLSNLKKLRKLFFTDFFYLSKENINLDKEIEEKTQIIEEIELFLQKNNPWLLFQKLFEIFDLENNLLKKYPLEEAQQLITTYRHIAEKLENMAYREQLDIYALKDRLISLINKSEIVAEGEDLYKTDSTINKVTIITIHSSKGLEYPIVFDYGALKDIRAKDNFYYFKNNQYIFEFENREKENLKKLDYEEYRRLHYVAITRAIVACYLPVMEEKKENIYKPSICCAKFLSFLIYDEQGEIREEFKDNVVTKEDKKLKILEKKTEKEKNQYQLVKINEKEIKEINKRVFTIRSFSSIHKIEMLEESIIEKKLTSITDETYEELILESENLPKGKKTGSMLHKILEKIDYTKDLDREENSKIIKDTINFFFVGDTEKEKYINATKNILNKLLNLNIISNIKLKDISLKDRINECEFYFSINNDFINGIIDFVFRVDNRYYIVDWKSNILLPEENCIKHFNENYKLQSEIYHYAFVKYLEKNIKAFDYNKHFGGIFFIYLRYLDNNGIVYIKPAYEEYKKILNNLKERVKELNEELNKD